MRLHSFLRTRQAERCAAPVPSSYSPLPSQALLRLGINVEAPASDLQNAYRRFLPSVADSGYYSALRSAFNSDAVGPADADDQLRWLSEQLRVEAPATDDPWPWWAATWKQAAVTAQVTSPGALGVQARRVLLDALLALPAYDQRLSDALAQAFVAQAHSSATKPRR